jgi:Ni/Co efflux regulator RcnB
MCLPNAELATLLKPQKVNVALSFTDKEKVKDRSKDRDREREKDRDREREREREKERDKEREKEKLVEKIKSRPPSPTMEPGIVLLEDSNHSIKIENVLDVSEAVMVEAKRSPDVTVIEPEVKMEPPLEIKVIFKKSFVKYSKTSVFFFD